MDINDVRAYITLATFLAFLGVCWWAYHGANKTRFEEDAMMPFASEEGTKESKEGDEDE